ncbi:saccharopine dehydrogenase / Homospermidine synthase family protein [Rhodotorula toruloides]|uniref:Saccharopine dehydrogenase / Homospermidine synthase family protein n=1 Tax=Rhodotorula toruloides TaxID=5286 RepID=A0A511K7J7_RHOTO|nr:saccharopine dehydrogenase / Homospermidine synthase family protein [Rhodotorula toruloides]
MSATKTYDILVMGASGFTGQLVSKYLATQAPLQKFTFAVGGRNRQKIEEKMREIGVEPAAVLIADSSDEEALRKAVKQVKVVISLIGPYLIHGEPLVCAEEGVHYVDLTGENPFIYKTNQKYGRIALENKATIIHCCGFDSIPSDIGAFLAVQRLKQVGGDEVRAGKVRTAFKAKGGMSGGTLASIVNMRETEDKDAMKFAADTYALSPIRGVHKGRPVVVGSQTFQGKTTWGAFFMMAPVNTAVVHRSWGILESADPSSRVVAYGPRFHYDEFLKMPGPISSFFASLTFFTVFGSILLISPIRWLVKRFGPKSGEGPSPEVQQNGWYQTTTVAKSEDGRFESRVVQKAKGDPGYLATSVLISSCALCLLKDYDRLPPIAKHGGFLTPSTALGNVLVERLEATGRFQFSIEDGGDGGKTR